MGLSQARWSAGLSVQCGRLHGPAHTAASARTASAAAPTGGAPLIWMTCTPRSVGVPSGDTNVKAALYARRSLRNWRAWGAA
ncbi:hypothetical protein BS50DRAFT_580448 [Corynespora cassiicola Philippines]|uniref:Uncharacterized protein n=1 Tax=Corynespora cassiicola Philippines TaxID=1448308 RepID=A0A2T2N022_CORCC|nr:hypothetical protein BS50DRAFT_580448 [Corynespora cassiicola Philippines]